MLNVIGTFKLSLREALIFLATKICKMTLKHQGCDHYDRTPGA